MQINISSKPINKNKAFYLTFITILPFLLKKSEAILNFMMPIFNF